MIESKKRISTIGDSFPSAVKCYSNVANVDSDGLTIEKHLYLHGR